MADTFFTQKRFDQDLATCGCKKESPLAHSLPPHPAGLWKELTVVHHGLLGAIPVHALPLEDTSSVNEPGRPRSAGMGRPPSAAGAGWGGGGGAGVAAPLVVLDRWVAKAGLLVVDGGNSTGSDVVLTWRVRNGRSRSFT